MCAIGVEMWVLAKLRDGIGAIVTVSAIEIANAIVIALMAFDAVVVDSKLKHSIGDLNSTNSIPILASNSVCVPSRYSVENNSGY